MHHRILEAGHVLFRAVASRAVLLAPVGAASLSISVAPLNGESVQEQPGYDVIGVCR